MIISKARALVLALVSFCLAFTFMLTSPNQSRALVPLAIPVAKIAGGLVLSYALEQGITTALNKSSLPDDSPVKKYGKWGAKLTGSRASLALGLLGGSIALATEVDWSGEGDPPDNAEDGDGYRMPRDFQDDLVRDDSEISDTLGKTVTFNVVGVTWDQTYTRSGHYRPRYIVECIGRVSTYSKDCGEDPFETRVVGDIQERINCRDGSTANASVTLNNKSLTHSSTSPPCRNEGGIASTFLFRVGTSDYVGITNRGLFLNPHAEGQEPEVGVTATTECSDGAGNIQTVSKTVGGADVVPVAECPVGWVPIQTNWERITRGGQTEWLGGVQQAPSEQYPDCAPGECTRVIKVDDQVCDATRPECADWLKTTAPERVKCEYGPYALGLEECADLEHLHKTTWGIVPNPDPAASPAWLPANPDGTPDYTRVDQDWAPDETVNPWYTPVTPGKWSTGSPSTDPSSTPTTVPGTPVEPGTGTEPGTDAPNTGFPSSGTNPDNDSQNCIAGMWSWNPVDWIYTPVKCALQWAFVPKPGQASQLMTNFKTEYAGTGLGTWSAVPASIISEFPTGEAGCKGPAMTVPQSLGGKTYYPLDACQEPMAQYAQMSKALISLLVVVFGGFSMANTISVAATGYPLFRREQQAVSV